MQLLQLKRLLLSSIRRIPVGPPAELGLTNVQICGHRTALVGDAAHAVTSVLGQGCNTALSTCSALDRALAACDPTDTQQLDGALEHYNSDWLPQAHALQHLEYMSVSGSQLLSGRVP